MNNEMVKELVETTGCDDFLATMLLRFTGGDVNGARRIIEAVPKDIFAVKLKFITQITGYYGACFFCFDRKENKIIRFIAIISDDKEIGKINLQTDWYEFEEQLYSYSRTKKIDGLKIDQLKNRLVSSEFISRVSPVLKPGQTVNNETFNNLIVDELYNVFADTNIAVKFDIEMTDAFKLNKNRDLRSEEAEVGESLNPEDVEKEREKHGYEGRKDQSLIVLRVDPVLSPVSGTEIKELEFGDEIQVRITDDRDIADYLAELIGGKVDSIRVPVFSKIIEVKELEGDSVGVFTQFGPGIFGMFKVPADAKVVTKIDEEESRSPVQHGRKEINPLIVVSGIVVVIVIFIILIFLSR